VPLTQSYKDWIEVGPPIPAGKYDVYIHYDGELILHLYRIFEQPFGVLAYPNPLKASEELTIQANSKIRKIEIFDINGVQQKLPIRYTPYLAPLTPYYISGFKKAGIYILHIYFDDHTVETIKIMVE
jgi:hypothetical protein